jgi:hypothetical protein
MARRLRDEEPPVEPAPDDAPAQSVAPDAQPDGRNSTVRSRSRSAAPQEEQAEPGRSKPSTDTKTSRASSLEYSLAEDLSSAGFKILLYGKPGAGKTYAASRSPRPIFLLTEANGLQSIRVANPKAAVFQVNTADKLREFMRAARNGELRSAGFETIVVDSLTEVQRLLQDELLSAKPNPADGMSLQDYGLLSERMRGFFRALRDLDHDVVATALDEEQVEEANGEIHVRPGFTGKKTGSDAAQYFNVVGYVYKNVPKSGSGERVVEHRVMLDGPKKYLTKSCHPLGGVLDTNIAEWLRLVRESS